MYYNIDVLIHHIKYLEMISYDRFQILIVKNMNILVFNSYWPWYCAAI